MKLFILSAMMLCSLTTLAQSVGVGTTTPNQSSVMDMGPSGKPVIIPRLSTDQMNNVTNDALGMVIYNTDKQQLYCYSKESSLIFNGIPLSINKWLPISTGPRIAAWGIIDSFGTVKQSSGNIGITWDATNNWYRLSISTIQFYKDSMMLMITPVGNGSWDQTVSVGELIEGSSRLASIKFTDVSRTALGWPSIDARRRSWFYFTLYNLRSGGY